MDLSAVGSADARHIHRPAAGDASDLILAVALVGERPFLAVGAGVVPLVERRAVGGAGGAERLEALAAQHAVGAVRKSPAGVGPEAEFGELRGAVAVVGGDVQPVIAVGGGVADIVGVYLEPSGEALVATGVERRPGRAVVGALELPVLRVARRHVVGAGDGVALDRLRDSGTEVILQPAHRRAEPFRGGGRVERLRGALAAARVVDAVVGRAAEG